MEEKKQEITTQRVYVKDVERVVAAYGKPFAKSLKRLLDELVAMQKMTSMKAEQEIGNNR